MNKNIQYLAIFFIFFFFSHFLWHWQDVIEIHLFNNKTLLMQGLIINELLCKFMLRQLLKVGRKKKKKWKNGTHGIRTHDKLGFEANALDHSAKVNWYANFRTIQFSELFQIFFLFFYTVKIDNLLKTP